MSDTKIVPTQYDGFTHNDVERIKVQSEYLRGTIKDGLVDPVTGSICDDDQDGFITLDLSSLDLDISADFINETFQFYPTKLALTLFPYSALKPKLQFYSP